MVLEIVRQRLAALQPVAQLGVRKVARHDKRPGQGQTGLDRMPGQLCQDFRHRPGEINLHHIVGEVLVGHFRHVFFRMHLELLEENAVLGDLAHGLAVRGAGDGKADRQRCAMARQADHAHVVAEVLATKLGADACCLRQLVDLFFHLKVTEGVTGFGALGRQAVEITCGCQLGGLQVHFGRGAADDDRQVVGRAGRRSERQDLFLQEVDHAIVGQQRRSALEQEGLVCGAAALGHEEELVRVVAFGIELDLGRHVVGGVLLLEHRQRRQLGIAQVLLEIGVARSFAEGCLIRTVGPHAAALLAHDDGRSGVLAHGQDAVGRNIRVLEKVEGNELVVCSSFRVIKDLAKLLQMSRAQIMVDVLEGFLCQQPQTFPFHHQDLFAIEAFRADEVRCQLAVRRLVFGQRKEGAVVILGRGHGSVH